ncbi:hypothetical protein ACGFIF_16335 [Kribbella sp. NPDC049174]|uniref:hypothetical protein n=1 Tax=Kribbella sp. NPDC049174 TaxID=3364112 RepID=UPI00370FC879
MSLLSLSETLLPVDLIGLMPCLGLFEPGSRLQRGTLELLLLEHPLHGARQRRSELFPDRRRYRCGQRTGLEARKLRSPPERGEGDSSRPVKAADENRLKLADACGQVTVQCVDLGLPCLEVPCRRLPGSLLVGPFRLPGQALSLPARLGHEALTFLLLAGGLPLLQVSLMFQLGEETSATPHRSP